MIKKVKMPDFSAINTNMGVVGTWKQNVYRGI